MKSGNNFSTDAELHRHTQNCHLRNTISSEFLLNGKVWGTVNYEKGDGQLFLGFFGENEYELANEY